MNNGRRDSVAAPVNEMEDHYDFRGGVRGKHVATTANGVTRMAKFAWPDIWDAGLIKEHHRFEIDYFPQASVGASVPRWRASRDSGSTWTDWQEFPPSAASSVNVDRLKEFVVKHFRMSLWRQGAGRG